MMKFRDVEQFVKDGSYEIDVPLDSIEETLCKWEGDFGLDLNPDFQRGHVWTQEQQTAYVEFILKGGKTAKIIYFNSPVFGRYEDTKELDSTILCVDGLQRLTAVRKFLSNKIKVFGHYFKEYEDRPSMMLGLKFNVNTLSTRKEVLEWYLQFNSGGTVHSQEELDRVRLLLEYEKA